MLLGDTAATLDAYDRYLRIRRNPDPPWRAEWEQVRAELAPLQVSRQSPQERASPAGRRRPRRLVKVSGDRWQRSSKASTASTVAGSLPAGKAGNRALSRLPGEACIFPHMTDLLRRLKAALADRYQIERELGRGGMATVYLAEDPKHHRHVAIKVLKPELAEALGPERFLREIAITGQLNHPHILPLLDSGEADGLVYYVMPYVEGESLRDRLDQEASLPLDDAVRYLRHVADALSAAHARGVVHRDIKPENVLLSGRHALVADFGVAKAVSAATEGPQLTTAGVSLGTPAYMAPEQAVGDPDIDRRADVYAFGVLAYEMLAGRLPLTGPTAQAIMAAHVTDVPEPIAAHRPELPEPLAAAVMRCLEKDADARWQSADDLLRELEALETPGGGIASVARPGIGSRRLGVTAILAVLVVVVLGVWGWRAARQAAALRWAREEAIPEVQRLIENDAVFDAWLLAQRVEERVPGDPVLNTLWPGIARTAAIETDPPGARVRIGEFGADTTEWVEIGVTPLTEVRVPRTYMRVRIERDGYEPFKGAALYWRFPEVYRLDSLGAVLSGMVRVPGGDTELQLSGLEHLDPVTIGDYLIDRHEVTNREFKVFVDSGGYEDAELWEHPFEVAGRRLHWDEATARLVDRTGRPGPATWEAGDYLTGQDDLPVTGVSWYEAAAYAKFVGKTLPTIYHWARAAETWASAWIVPRSNLDGDGSAPGGQFGGMGPYGTFDMAGNAREWCLNAVGDERYILGGGWNDPAYAFNDAYAQSPFDRSVTNGIRLAHQAEGSHVPEAELSITRLSRDFLAEQPVSDEVFAAYRRFFDYDPTPLEAVVVAVDTTEDWVRERVAYNTAYGERMFGYLFLPRRGEPPYQTVVYFPGSNAIYRRSSEGMVPNSRVDFLLKSGRAVLHPIYKSTYERGDSLRTDYANETAFYKEHVIAWVKDYRRSVDYLETRNDIDTTKLAYFGFSWGGYLGGLIPAIESRLKVSVLYVAGLEFQQGLPEVEPLNYLPRITIPVLMLNGEYDHYFQKETSQRPMFELLGTPAEHKRWVVYEGGHFVPRARLISETLDWLDEYLGPTR